MYVLGWYYCHARNTRAWELEFMRMLDSTRVQYFCAYSMIQHSMKVLAIVLITMKNEFR